MGEGRRKSVLIVGYGNPLRSDDGAGPKVAEMIAQQGREDVRSLAVHQLTPELAEEIVEAGTAIFVDGISSNSTTISIQPLQPVPRGVNFSHLGNPRSLLSLTQILYGQIPPAWWILIPGINFEFGEQLSPITERLVLDACREIEQIIDSYQLSVR